MAARRGERGQALVEFALVFPLMIATLLLVIDVVSLEYHFTLAQNGLQTLATLAARGSGWQADTQGEDQRSGCRAAPVQPEVSYPDGSPAVGNRVLLTWHCHPVTWATGTEIPIAVQAEAVIQ